MNTELLTFTQQYVDSGVSRAGNPFTKNTFVATDGRRFETFEAGVAAQMAATLNTPITVTYETVVNGQYTNLRIKSVESVGNGAQAFQQGQLGGSIPPQTAPALPQTVSPTPVVTENADDRQLRIMRQSAIERVALFVGAGIIEAPGDLDEAFQAADTFIDYFVNGRQVQAAATAGPVA